MDTYHAAREVEEGEEGETEIDGRFGRWRRLLLGLLGAGSRDGRVSRVDPANPRPWPPPPRSLDRYLGQHANLNLGTYKNTRLIFLR